MAAPVKHCSCRSSAVGYRSSASPPAYGPRADRAPLLPPENGPRTILVHPASCNEARFVPADRSSRIVGNRTARSRLQKACQHKVLHRRNSARSTARSVPAVQRSMARSLLSVEFSPGGGGWRVRDLYLAPCSALKIKFLNENRGIGPR